MVCVCIHKQDVVYYCANGHIICEVFKSESAFCRRYLVEESLAVSRSLPFLRTTNPTGSVEKLFLSHVIFFHILSQKINKKINLITGFTSSADFVITNFLIQKRDSCHDSPMACHGPWITKVPCAPVTVPTKAKPKDSGSCGSKVWPSPVLKKWGKWPWKCGENMGKSHGNPWEINGKSLENLVDQERLREFNGVDCHENRPRFPICFARQNVEWGSLWNQQQKFNSHHKPSIQIYQTEHEDILRPPGSVQWNRCCSSSQMVCSYSACWLVVEPPLWKIWKSMGRIIPCMKWKIKNVWNHQPACIYVCDYHRLSILSNPTKEREVQWLFCLSLCSASRKNCPNLKAPASGQLARHMSSHSLCAAQVIGWVLIIVHGFSVPNTLRFPK